MYNLSDFAFSDMVDCGAKLRNIASAAGSMEEASQLVVSYLYDTLHDDLGDRACALVRCFVTHPYDELEPELQQFATTVLGREPAPRTKSLTLLATAGERPAWNDRRQSVAHRSIPLAGEQMVAQSPMIFQLITQFGLDIGTLLEPEPGLILDLEQRTYNVFHVAEAAGSPFVPAQEEFVLPFGVKSVLGFGGVLPGGNLVAFILFAKCNIKSETAALFKTLALAAKLALMPFALGPLLRPAPSRATTGSRADDDSQETVRARLTALEQLLDVYETVAAEQARKLELALAQLQTADERFRSLAQNSSDLITVVDRNSRITYQSPSLATVLGYLPDSLQGTDWYDLVHPDDAPSVRDHLTGVMAAPQPSGGSGEARLRHADGSWRQTEIRTENLLANPAVAGVVLNVRDIGERRKGEMAVAQARDEAVEASSAKSDFLAVMSHEIRTPMNGVIGLTGLLLDSALSDTQRHQAEGVRASGEALLGIINDILDFSKIEAGKLELETVNFDLAQAMEDVVGLVAESARAKGLALVIECPPGLPTALRGDVGRLRQILLNLATNAVKFTDAGRVVLRAELVDRLPFGEVVVRLEVSDTGIGVDPATAARIFDPFSQADPSTTRRYGGTGLGLAICRRLAEAMGGAIGLDSRPGEGASFWVQLPFAPATERVGTADRASVARSPAVAAQSQGTLLVVEDQAINQEVAKGILWKLGYRCDVAGDGVEALAALERRSYDAILMDCRMERMDGFQATAEIRRREAGGRRVPIIAMTASAQVADRERCIAVGMDDYLSKPVSERDLQIVLNRWVSHGDGDLAQRGGGAGAGSAPAEVDGVLDPEQLDRLRELAESSGNPVFLAGLVEKFATEAASLLVDLAATTERRDPEALRSAVHSLKGSSATMGAAAVASACDALEAAAGRGELPTPKVLARIAGELDRAFTALRAAASPTAP